MADTSPSEIAALIGNDERYRTFVVLKLQDHGNRLTNIENSMGTVKSSVNDYDENKQQLLGAKRLVVGTSIAIAALYGCVQAVFWVIGQLKP